MRGNVIEGIVFNSYLICVFIMFIFFGLVFRFLYGMNEVGDFLGDLN